MAPSIRVTVLAACLAAAACSLSGCKTPQEKVEDRRTKIVAPAITHMVLIQLKDPTRTAELIEDCNRSLPGIASVLSYACGQPFPSNRPNVMTDYAVGIYVAFADEDGYKAYADDPAHLALVEKWRTAWKDIRIYDFLDMPHPIVPAAQPAPAATPEPAR